MNKQITTAQARSAVEAAHRAGLEVGAFFILCYPGETDDTRARDAALRHARCRWTTPVSRMPYPLPGTALHERVGERVTRAWRPQQAPARGPRAHLRGRLLGGEDAVRDAQGPLQFEMKRRLGSLAPAALRALRRAHRRAVPAAQVAPACGREPTTRRAAPRTPPSSRRSGAAASLVDVGRDRRT